MISFARANLIGKGCDQLAMAKPHYDARIDFFRGLALIFIFINHIPENGFSYFTSRQVALFDSAEVFMFLGGYSAALAYGSLASGDLQPLAQKALRRALTILCYHLGLLAIVLAASYVLSVGYSISTGYEIFIEKVQAEPLSVLLAAPLLAFQAPLLDILPIYIAVMLAAPFMIWLLARSPIALLAVSGVIWMFAARFFPLVPTVTFDIYWGFNPFCWQFLFVIGLVCGWYGRAGGLPIASAEGRSVLDMLGLAVVLFSGVVLFFVTFHDIEIFGAGTLRGFYWSLNKQCLDLWRIVGLIASAYVIARLISKQEPLLLTRTATWVRAAGAHSLPVFSLGVVLSFTGKFVTRAFESSLAVDFVVTAVGTTILLGAGVLLREINADRVVLALPTVGDSRAA